jgi:acyl-CoA thioesterase FadM
MNLFFRLIWIVISSFFKPRIDFSDEIVLNLRILPNDLDINRHLNNGRYLTILDLGSIDLFLRSGVLFRAIRNGFRPMIGGLIVTYRKGLSLFERFRLTMRLEAWDDRWNYFQFEFKKLNGQLSAAGYFKGALVSKNGLVPNNVADEIFGYKRGSCVLPPAVENWIKAESHISGESITQQRNQAAAKITPHSAN